VKPHDAEGLEQHAPLVQVWVQPGQGAAGHFEEAAEETPVALALNGISQAVMMATPSDLEDFALGFALTEGWLDQRHQLLDVEVQVQEDGIVIDLATTAACEQRQRARRRSLAGRTGCGLCGVESLHQLKPQAPARSAALPTRIDLDFGAVVRASTGFRLQQPLQARCGGMHAAAWCDLEGEVLLVREDVGRHNALDKLIGALMRQDAALTAGFVFISSRCSYELVQKISAAGIGALACVSAPTAHAVRTAAAGGVSLWGFVREGRASRYA
jgi:FdhD protein